MSEKISRRYFAGAMTLAALGAVFAANGLSMATTQAKVALETNRQRLDALLEEHRKHVRRLLGGPKGVDFGAYRELDKVDTEILQLATTMVRQNELTEMQSLAPLIFPRDLVL